MAGMQDHIPGDKSLDNSLALLHEGYLYIPNRVQKFQSDLFTMRFLGEEVVCMSGEEAANVFYDPERFQRHGAAPKRIQETLFGVGGIQTLDGEAHDHRRKLFLSLLERGHQKQMAELVRKQLTDAIVKWETAERIVLFDEAGQLLCRAVCQWAGVPLPEDERRHGSEASSKTSGQEPSKPRKVRRFMRWRFTASLAGICWIRKWLRSN